MSVSVCVRVCLGTRLSISDSPICEQQPCLLIPRPESSSSLSAGKRAASAQDELGGARREAKWGEGGREGVGFCLHLGINHSLHRCQTSTPRSPLAPSPRCSGVILFSSPVPSHPSPLSLSHTGLIYSSFPKHLLLSLSFHTSCTLFLSVSPCSYLLPSPSLSPSFLAMHPPTLSPSSGQSISQSRALSSPQSAFASRSALTLITYHRHILFSTFCLSVSIGGQGEQPALSWWGEIASRDEYSCRPTSLCPQSPCRRGLQPADATIYLSEARRDPQEGFLGPWLRREPPPAQSEPNSSIWATSDKCEDSETVTACPGVLSLLTVTERTATPGAEDWKDIEWEPTCVWWFVSLCLNLKVYIYFWQDTVLQRCTWFSLKAPRTVRKRNTANG